MVETFESRKLHLQKIAVSSTRIDLLGRCCRTTRGRLMGLRGGLRHALDRKQACLLAVGEALQSLHTRRVGCDAGVSVRSNAAISHMSQVCAGRCRRGAKLPPISVLQRPLTAWHLTVIEQMERVRLPVGRQSDRLRGTCRPLALWAGRIRERVTFDCGNSAGHGRVLSLFSTSEAVRQRQLDCSRPGDRPLQLLDSGPKC